MKIQTYSSYIVYLTLLNQDKFINLIQNICPGINITQDTNLFINILRRQLIKKFHISKKLLSLAELNFLEIP